MGVKLEEGFIRIYLNRYAVIVKIPEPVKLTEEELEKEPVKSWLELLEEIEEDARARALAALTAQLFSRRYGLVKVIVAARYPPPEPAAIVHAVNGLVLPDPSPN